MKRFFVIAAVLMSLSACESLPATGPNPLEIEKFADTKPAWDQESKQRPRLRFELVDVDKDVLAALSKRHPKSFAKSFSGKGSASTNKVGRGDVVSVTIWEGAQGGLFNGADGASASGVPQQPVAADGTIVVPFVGRVRAANRTTYQIKRTIEIALEGKAIDPQVLVSVVKPVFNTVTVTGETAQGGRIPLSGRGDRLLDVLASAGGTSAPVKQIAVQLTRGKKTQRVPLSRIVAKPAENIYMRPGDVVTLFRDQPSITVFGATGSSTEVPIEVDDTRLTDALARAGGLKTTVADPRAVFIYRVEQAHLVSHLLPKSKLAKNNSVVPVIYRVNLRDPSGFFVAKAFEMLDGDIIYAADSPAVEFGKFTTILSQGIGAVSSGQSLVKQF